MPFIDRFINYYTIEVFCLNCEKVSRQRLPKGLLLVDFFKKNQGKCRFCGSNKLRKATNEEVHVWKLKNLGEDYW